MTAIVRAALLRATAIRQSFDDSRLIRVAGAHDGLTARIAEEAGFDAVWASSFGISASYGLPDLSLLGLAEYLQASSAMQAATCLPVLADCDTGFGDAVNSAYVMSRFESAGIAAICIEDKVFPKRNSFVESGQEQLPASEFARKVEAATAVRAYPDTLMIARTESLICGAGVDDALRRCHLYVDAGADAVLVHSKDKHPGEIKEFLRRWERRAPVVIVPTTYPDWQSDDAAAAGVSMIIYANQAIRAVVSTAREILEAILRDGSSSNIETSIASVRDLFDLSQLDKWLEVGS
jgi:phosphoenolpyruvate phosphomutase